MLTQCQTFAREGYYFDRETGDIFRVVGSDLASELTLISDDLTLPFDAVHALALARFDGRVSGRFVTIQTVRQLDGQFVTEETETFHS